MWILGLDILYLFIAIFYILYYVFRKWIKYMCSENGNPPDGPHCRIGRACLQMRRLGEMMGALQLRPQPVTPPKHLQMPLQL